MNLNIARAIAASMTFFEFSSDEELNPDDAVEMMEVISSYLVALSEPEQLELSDAFKQISAEWSSEAREFVAKIMENCLG